MSSRRLCQLVAAPVIMVAGVALNPYPAFTWQRDAIIMLCGGTFGFLLINALFHGR